MAGLELLNTDATPATAESLQVIKAMLHRGYILLPEGEHGNIISFTPPLTITEEQLTRMVNELQKVLANA
jgi:4-aminobutyrate aminotransferase-like enzyme